MSSVIGGTLSRMPDERIDPSQNTQAFQAWVQQPQPAAPAKSRAGLWIAVAVGVAVVAGLVIVLVTTL